MRLSYWAMVGLVLAVAAPVQAQTEREFPRAYALTNARIVVAPGRVIERGTVVIRDRRIVAVGAQVPAPQDAVQLDLAGKTVYPGLIDAASTVGIPPVGGAGGGRGGGGPEAPGQRQGPGSAQPAPGRPEPPPETRPYRSAADVFGPGAADLEVLRSAGITTVGLVFDAGLLPGQVAVASAGSGDAAGLVLKTPVAQQIVFGRKRGGYPGTLMGAVAYLKQAFYDADYAMRVEQAFQRNPASAPRPTHSNEDRALFPVLRGELPVWINASTVRDFSRATDLVREFKLTNYVLLGAQEGWLAADELKAAAKPVIVSLDFPNAGQITGRAFEQHVAPVTGRDTARERADSAAARTARGNAAALQRAGVPVALSGYGVAAGQFRDRLLATVEAGLSADDALRALTVTPARIVGLESALGTVEAGKLANLVITEGDLFARTGRIRHVFVEGERFDITQAPPAQQQGGQRGGGRRGGGGAPAAAPVDVTGGWAGAFEIAGTTSQFTMTLRSTGTEVTGTLQFEFGNFPVTGSINGNDLALRSSVTPPARTTVTVDISGRVANDEIRGTVTVQGQAPTQIVLRRQADTHTAEGGK
jgi:imidazolonepropionase-like amidohydrolase